MGSHNDDEHHDHPTDQPSSEGSSSREQGGARAEPYVIETSEPAISSESVQRTGRLKHPDQTSVIETSEIHETNAAGTPIVSVQPRDRADRRGDSPQGGKSHSANGSEGAKDPHKNESKAQKEHDSDDHPKPPPSMGRILLFAGVLSLICGMAGAFAYSTFFGSGKSDDKASSGDDSGFSKSDDSSKGPSKGSSKNGSTSKSSGGSDAQSASDAKPPDFNRSDEPDSLKMVNENLTQRIDGLSEKMDQLTVPRDQTPNEIRMLQVKVNQMARTVEGVRDASDRMSRIENQLENLNQQLKALSGSQSSTSNGAAANGKAPSIAPAPNIPAPPTPSSYKPQTSVSRPVGPVVARNP